MKLFLFLFPLQHIKRPALQNKQFVVLRMAFGPEKFSGLSRNGPLQWSNSKVTNRSAVTLLSVTADLLVTKCECAQKSNIFTFLKYGGNSQKINSAHIHRLDRPWCETNHDILRLAEYRFIYEKIDNNRILSKCRFSCSKFKKNLKASRHKMKQPRPIKTIKS